MELYHISWKLIDSCSGTREMRGGLKLWLRRFWRKMLNSRNWLIDAIISQGEDLVSELGWMVSKYIFSIQSHPVAVYSS